MSLQKVNPGAKAPEEFNVIIEIPMNADPIKYEVDKASGALFVDRFMTTAMHYPCNYGYIPKTLSDDGDPVDVLVITPFALTPGVVVTCRAIGMLEMDDEAGGDAKLLAVPIDKILPIYSHWKEPGDINQMRLKAIQHFFEHYKDLEPNKWVKVKGWQGSAAAKDEIRKGIAAYKPADAGA
jgi:inorganic pyrophosphatase